MKTRTHTIGYLLVLLTLLGVGILIVQTMASVTATVRITPFLISEEDPAPELYRVTMTLPKSSGYKPSDIDPATVLVEGIPMATIPDWPKVTKNFFAFKVDGPTLTDIIWGKIWHIGPPPGSKTDVTITVTGQFYDTTTFQGTCQVTFMTLHASPPPPPQ